MDFEKKLGRLEDIVAKMEGNGQTLEESIKLFEEGVRLSQECHKELEQAEQKVQVLLSIDDKGQPVTEKLER